MNNFKEKEFTCKCGTCGLGYEEMDKDVLEALDKARDIAGVPFIINSAMRCPEHNEKEGGSPTSSHLNGFAIDVSCTTSSQRYAILGALFAAGFTRIGIAKTFIHVDMDKSKSSELVWLY